MSVRICRCILQATLGLVLVLAPAALCRAACIPANLATPPPQDPIARALALQQRCPKNAREFGDALKRLGARLEPTMVNFVGFHNADAGAFFMFEIASTDGQASPAVAIPRGDLVFGHFTNATGGGGLVSNETGRLVIEAIAWDPGKQFYNFYELFDGAWVYRGDSKDILDDIQALHRDRNAGANPFGNRLRCSGCHTNGGLVQKELAAPHNDWFLTARKLPLGSLRPDPFVKAKIAALVDAGELSRLVAASPRRLADSPGYRKVLAERSRQERLRPLFCAVELNIESDSSPFDDRKQTVAVPSAFFVDRRLAAADVPVARAHYDAALVALRSELPETPGRADADHAWLTPVKANSDVVAIDSLIEQGILDQEFVADVLAVDFTNPVFSASRCGLLKLVPLNGGSDFVTRFQDALRRSSLPGAAELLDNLTNPERTAAFHAKRAGTFLAACRERAADKTAVLGWTRLLAQRRAEVTDSEISKAPRGHILEDPERIVFPSTAPAAVSGRLALAASCDAQ